MKLHKLLIASCLVSILFSVNFFSTSAINAKTNSHHLTKTTKKSNSSKSFKINAAFKESYRSEALDKINALRASNGQNPLIEDPILNQIADTRVAQNIARGNDTISHYNSKGKALVDNVAHKMGLTGSFGENLAMETLESKDPVYNAKSLISLYINEGPNNGDGKEHGHYENLISPDYTKVGIGVGVSNKHGETNIYEAEVFSIAKIHK